MKPKVLIVGTYHFASDLDMITHNDTFNVDKDQNEIQDLLNFLAGFNPSALAVEITKDKQDSLDKEYQSYLDGGYDLSSNEVHQVMYRLGKHLQVNRIHAVDWMDTVGNRGLGDVMEWAKRHQNDIYEEVMDMFMEDQIDQNSSIVENLLKINADKSISNDHRAYMKIAQIGEGTDYVGIDWVRWWYQRNLIIYRNLIELVSSGHDKIMLFIGAGHIYLLKQFLGESGEVDVLTFNGLIDHGSYSNIERQ